MPRKEVPPPPREVPVPRADVHTGRPVAYPMARTRPDRPPDGFARLGRIGPVARVMLPDGTAVWAVTGHAEIRSLLADSRVSSDPAKPGFPRLRPVPDGRPARREPEPGAERPVRTFVEMDEPVHAVHRRIAIPAFSVRRIRALRPLIEKDADHLLDRLLETGPPADLVPGFAVPLPSMALGHLFGLPWADHAYFRERADAAVLDKGQAGPALTELRGYFDRLLATRPGGGLLGHLVMGDGRGRVTRAELAAMCVMIVVAGHETTANTIALSVPALLGHPDQLALMRSGPGAAPAVVEELLRFLTVPETILRSALADIVIGGRVIRAGDGVLLLPAAANRDRAAFPDPDVLNAGRAARHHLAFGHGVHQCLGQNLARLELEVALSALFRRIPGLRLTAPAARLPLKGPGGLQGVAALPVSW
ncbi:MULTISPECIES: cytochrome P450 [Thermomonosporaceae]|uniref:cytochrome P450 n=1 Tax=Thermomonosporaceae TaxID=2012 RepID=UPI00255B0300|nr:MULTISPECIES: cytochrome P450 [Thermomonosporaceae]MDL4775416.1 cytochrome P450 [Actinomadura xylanilytica]